MKIITHNEAKMGDTFEYKNGKTYVAVYTKLEDCQGCAFNNEERDNCACINVPLGCNNGYRWIEYKPL